MRAGRGLRMKLGREDRPLAMAEALRACRRSGCDASSRRPPGRVAGSTAKPWFWEVMMTCPVERSCTGWFAPRWPNFSLNVVAPSASPSSWWPETDPEDGLARVDERLDRPDRPGQRRGIAGPVREEDAVGLALQDLVGRGRRRKHRDATGARLQETHDVALHAVVDGRDAELLLPLPSPARPALRAATRRARDRSPPSAATRARGGGARPRPRSRSRGRRASLPRSGSAGRARACRGRAGR